MGIKRGDQVIISRHGASSMRITLPHDHTLSADGASSSEVILNISKNDTSSATVRKIISLYLQGFATIHITRKNTTFGSAQRAAIKDTVRRTLVGAEIISDSSRGITIQILVDTLALSVVGAFKRMLHLSESMLSDAITAVKNNDIELAKEVINADDEVDRFGFYIIRQLKLAVGDESLLREIGIINVRNCLDYRLVVKSVERAGDHAVSIARILVEFGKGINPSLADKLKAMADYASISLDNACLALFTNDYALAEKTLGTTDLARLEKQVLEFARKTKTEEGYRVRRMVEDIRRVAEYASDIAEIVLNMNIERVTQLGTQETTR